LGGFGIAHVEPISNHWQDGEENDFSAMML
jgi:hypothetical protein